MSDLTPIGDVLVRAHAGEDPSADELRARHLAIQEDFKRNHRDEETLALQMAWLALIAIERVRRMEESHHGDRRRPSGPDPGPRPAAVQRRGIGWANVGSPREPAPSRPE